MSRRTVVAPQPETITYHNIKLNVEFKKCASGSGFEATVSVDEKDADNLRMLPRLDVVSGYFVRCIRVTKGGECLKTYFDWEDLKYSRQGEVAHQVAEEQNDGFNARITALQARCEELKADGWPVSVVLEGLIAHAGDVFERCVQRPPRWNSTTEDNVRGALKEAERELRRMESMDLIDLLAEYLLDGLIAHPDIRDNQSLLMYMTRDEIRSGGYLRAPDRETLKGIYRDRLAGLDCLEQVGWADLRLRREDFFSGSVELAPMDLKLGIGKIGLNYEYRELNGTKQPTAVIVISDAQVEELLQLAKLPSGVQLYAHVWDRGGKLAEGFVYNGELEARLMKARAKAVKKARNARKSRV